MPRLQPICGRPDNFYQICDRWFHAKCQGLEEETFKVMASTDHPGVGFFCKECCVAAVGIINMITQLSKKHEALEKKVDKISKEVRDKVSKNEIKINILHTVNPNFEEMEGKLEEVQKIYKAQKKVYLKQKVQIPVKIPKKI